MVRPMLTQLLYMDRDTPRLWHPPGKTPESCQRDIVAALRTVQSVKLLVVDWWHLVSILDPLKDAAVFPWLLSVAGA